MEEMEKCEYCEAKAEYLWRCKKCKATICDACMDDHGLCPACFAGPEDAPTQPASYDQPEEQIGDVAPVDDGFDSDPDGEVY